MSVFCCLHVSASLAFMECLVLLFCFLRSCRVLINKNVINLKLLYILLLLLIIN